MVSMVYILVRSTETNLVYISLTWVKKKKQEHGALVVQTPYGRFKVVWNLWKLISKLWGGIVSTKIVIDDHK